MRLVILGSGERRYEEAIVELGRKYPGRVAIRVAYDNALAHKIEAGADAYLMPSRYEPCGLNQIYSLKYGTVPIVRNTGGLADTVADADVNPAEGNGFVFHEYDPGDMKDAISRALAAFADRRRWERHRPARDGKGFFLGGVGPAVRRPVREGPPETGEERVVRAACPTAWTSNPSSPS